MTENTFLENVLGSKTKIKILSTLFRDESRILYEKELADLCGAAVSEVNRQIKSLVEFGLIIYTRKGKKKFYQLNRTHFLYVPLKEVFRAT
ncbi:MAG: winged helix-turn-helix domain-containing protein [bacterium]